MQAKPKDSYIYAVSGTQDWVPDIVIAEDDEDDRFLIEQAFEASGIRNNIRFVSDGHGLMTLLARLKESRGRLPGLILLDLNMPRKDGRQVLRELKHDPLLRKIPVIIFTTSNAREDIAQCYELGANAFITKPVTLARFTEILKNIKAFWFRMAELPGSG
jgi:CheY-like chemotaxis protein